MSRLITLIYLFHLHAEYILREARLKEDEHGFKIGRKNINHQCYILVDENAEDLQGLVIKLKKHSEKNIKTKLMTKGRTSLRISNEDIEAVGSFCILGSTTNSK